MKKIFVAVISLVLVLLLSFGAYADIIQPNATQFELGYTLSTSPTSIQDIVSFSALPYTYNAQLMCNGNNNALYTAGLYNISGFTQAGQIATSYDFVGGQAYEVTYRFSMQFADNSLASFLDFIDPELIDINAYFTNGNLVSDSTSISSVSISSLCSNYSASVANINVVNSHDPNIAGTVSFDIVLLFKLNLNYSGDYHKIMLYLDFQDFATAIPSGNSGFFYCKLTYSSLTNYTSPGWNSLPLAMSGICSYISSSDTVNSGNISTISSYINTFDFYSATFKIGTFSYSQFFLPGYSYRGTVYFEIDRSISNGVLSPEAFFYGIGLCGGNRNLGSSPQYPITYLDLFPDYSFVVTEDNVVVTSGARKVVYKVDFGFTVPIDFEYYYQFLTFVINTPSISSGAPYTFMYYPPTGYNRISAEFDSSGTLLTPDDPDDPGGGGDDSGGSVDLSGVESGIQSIEDLINGEPIEHDTALGEGIEGLDSFENALLDDAGADTALDAFGDLVDEFDLMEDTPNADTGLWINRLVNPIFGIFGIFIIFPLLIGVVGALLGRRYTL